MMLHRATLLGRNLSNGLDFINDDVPVGKAYYVDLNATAKLTFALPDRGLEVTLSCILAYDRPDGGYHGFMPMELLKIEADA